MEQEEVWDAIAGKWADFRTRATEEVVEFLENKKGKVLDLGCGAGRHCLSGTADLGFYGVDFSEELLKFARKKDYAQVKKGYTWDVPYDDGFFDYVVFSRVLHCVDSAEKRRKSLEEVFRVLKVRGEALITTWGEKGCKRLKSGEKEGFSSWSVGGVLNGHTVSLDSRNKNLCGGDSGEPEKVGRYTYVYDRDELVEELKEVGFEILRLEVGKNILVVVRKG